MFEVVIVFMSNFILEVAFIFGFILIFEGVFIFWFIFLWWSIFILQRANTQNTDLLVGICQEVDMEITLRGSPGTNWEVFGSSISACFFLVRLKIKSQFGISNKYQLSCLQKQTDTLYLCSTQHIQLVFNHQRNNFWRKYSSACDASFAGANLVWRGSIVCVFRWQPQSDCSLSVSFVWGSLDIQKYKEASAYD